MAGPPLGCWRSVPAGISIQTDCAFSPVQGFYRRGKGKQMIKTSFFILFGIFLCCVSCTFDYGEDQSSGEDVPNLVMENVEYVRVRSADPLARIKAERVERYEKQNLMKLENLTFEQFGNRGEEINVYGKAGYAQVEIDTGDIFLDRNIRLDVTTEDIILETNQLEWKDHERSLSGGENTEVFIYKDNGTRFTGRGLRIDARRKFWEFTGSVRGTYIHDDKKENE
jgi:LPS export ABC transporter protein LptC